MQIEKKKINLKLKPVQLSTMLTKPQTATNFRLGSSRGQVTSGAKWKVWRLWNIVREDGEKCSLYLVLGNPFLSHFVSQMFKNRLHISAFIFFWLIFHSIIVRG